MNIIEEMTASYEVHECQNCGLRYPLTEGHSFGIRCPSCLGETKIVLTRSLDREKKSVFYDLTKSPRHTRRGELSALLDNIRSAWNVGSIFRTADGFGLKHLYLCGITPMPETEAVKKTSLGAEETVTWAYSKNAILTGRELKSKGYQLFALEEDKRSIPIQSARGIMADEKVVLVIGNEVTGVDPELLDLCDQVLFIPMFGNKKSFNVAVAFAVAAFTLSVQDK